MTNGGTSEEFYKKEKARKKGRGEKSRKCGE
jgi:hypothetical protein